MLWFMFEKFFGFGRKKTETKVDENGGKVSVEIKEWHLRTQDQVTSEIMFRNMSFYLSIFTPLLAMCKLGALLFGRLYIVK